MATSARITDVDAWRRLLVAMSSALGFGRESASTSLWLACRRSVGYGMAFGFAGPPLGLALVVGLMSLISVGDAFEASAVWPIGNFVRALPDVIALVPAAYEWGLVPAAMSGVLTAAAGAAFAPPVIVRLSLAFLVGAITTTLWLAYRGFGDLAFLIVVGAVAATILTAAPACLSTAAPAPQQ